MEQTSRVTPLLITLLLSALRIGTATRRRSPPPRRMESRPRFWRRWIVRNWAICFAPHYCPNFAPRIELLEKYFAAKTAAEARCGGEGNCRHWPGCKCARSPLPHSLILAANRRRRLLHQRKSRAAPGDVFRRSSKGIRQKYLLAAGDQAPRSSCLHHRPQARPRRSGQDLHRLDSRRIAKTSGCRRADASPEPR